MLRERRAQTNPPERGLVVKRDDPQAMAARARTREAITEAMAA